MLEKYLIKLKKMMYYFAFSCLAAVVDFFVVALLFKWFSMNYLVANTLGIIVGFIFHFILSSKRVFDTKLDIKSFSVYLVTFLIGLLTANAVIYASFEVLHVDFYVSKLLSMAVPFFITYFLRTVAYDSLKEIRYGEHRI